MLDFVQIGKTVRQLTDSDTFMPGDYPLDTFFCSTSPEGTWYFRINFSIANEPLWETIDASDAPAELKTTVLLLGHPTE